MAEIRPLQALRYDVDRVGSLGAVVAPPYDVIDDALRAQLAAKSAFNVVEIDLPRPQVGGSPEGDGSDPYLHARTLFERWRAEGVLVRDREPSLWVMTQQYTGPDGVTQMRHGFFCRVRVEEYGAGRIRPHERTHPGPKEDRLRLTRATRANLSPIFSLYDDPDGVAWAALEPATAGEPMATVVDADDTTHRLWQVADPEAIAAVTRELATRELLIADGHHRYETARVYAEERGGEGDHRYVLMFLCSLSDSGLTIFPTHRLLSELDEPKKLALRETLLRDFDVERIEADALQPTAAEPGIAFGYIDSFHQQAFRVTLKDQAIADAALPDKPDAYRRLDTAVLEAIVLRGALGMTEDDIAHMRGLAYSKSFDDALDAIKTSRHDAAFFMRPTPVDQVREVAETGESMPPKSTFFFPKIPTGMVFNTLD